MLEILLVAVLIGLVPATIAKTKGHSFFVWWLYGAAIWIVAFPHSLFLKKDQEALDRKLIESGVMKKCPKCAELVKQEASVCRFCGSDFTSGGGRTTMSVTPRFAFDPERK